MRHSFSLTVCTNPVSSTSFFFENEDSGTNVLRGNQRGWPCFTLYPTILLLLASFSWELQPKLCTPHPSSKLGMLFLSTQQLVERNQPSLSHGCVAAQLLLYIRQIHANALQKTAQMLVHLCCFLSRRHSNNKTRLPWQLQALPVSLSKEELHKQHSSQTLWRKSLQKIKSA